MTDATKNVLVGVDAGGSHTAAVVADRRLNARGRASGPPGAVFPGHAAAAADAIAFTVREALAAAGTDMPAALLVVGAAGTGRATERDELVRALADYGLAERVEVTTDAAIALESVFHSGPGILLNAGSGSIAYARDADGVVWRVGGLGWQMGDEGSGYWIGRAALSASGKAADGRGPSTALSAALAGAIGAASLDDMVDWAGRADHKEVASLTRTVCHHARHGDAVARALVEAAGRELAEHVIALLHRFPGAHRVDVALAGGVLSPDSPVRDALLRILAEDAPAARHVDVVVDPTLGALTLAARLAG